MILRWQNDEDTQLQKETKRLIDSIGKLPAKARKLPRPYKAKLEALYKELGDAMHRWKNGWMSSTMIRQKTM